MRPPAARLIIFCNLILLVFNIWWFWEFRSRGPVETSVEKSAQKANARCSKLAWNFNWDWRHPHQPFNYTHPDENFSFRWKYLFLVRHGHYHKISSPNYPQKFGHLTKLGESQAHMVGRRLKELNITIHRFVTSTSIRAAETAGIIHTYLPSLLLEEDELLKEGWPLFPDPPQPGWNPKNPRFFKDAERLKMAFEKYVHRASPLQHVDTNEVIVAHGNIIAYFVLKALQMPVERWLKIAVQHASITMLVIFPDGNVDLRILGDVGHIPQSQWTI